MSTVNVLHTVTWFSTACGGMMPSADTNPPRALSTRRRTAGCSAGASALSPSWTMGRTPVTVHRGRTRRAPSQHGCCCQPHAPDPCTTSRRQVGKNDNRDASPPPSHTCHTHIHIARGEDNSRQSLTGCSKVQVRHHACRCGTEPCVAQAGGIVNVLVPRCHCGLDVPPAKALEGPGTSEAGRPNLIYPQPLMQA